MNVYALNQRRHNSSGIKDTNMIRMKNRGTTSTSLFSGSSLSILSTVCASCSSSLGFILTSVLGTGLVASVSAFLYNYQTPLRIVSILISLWSYYSVSKGVESQNCCCSIVNNDHNSKSNN